MAPDTATATGSRATPSTAGCRVGVLSFHNSKETKAILNAIDALGHTPVWLREENARTWLQNGTIHLDPAVDIIANRLLLTKAEQPLDDLEVAASYEAARPMLNSPTAVMRATHKYTSTATLTAAGLPVPDAYWAFTHQTVNERAQPDTEDDQPATKNEPQLEGPTVHKPAIGTNGGQMSLVDAGDTITSRIGRRRAFLQEFLDTTADPPFDVRVYIVGDRIIGAMKRYAPPGEWRTNVALGGETEDVTDDLAPTAAELARRATAVLDLDYAGVDLLHRGGTWYVLEVNATAGFTGLYDATGKSPAPAIAQLAIGRFGGTVETDRVSELASTLDDSVPACKPDRNPTPNPKQPVGYTERITVSGGHDLKRVTAKADTGAKRTSVDLEVAAAVGGGPLTGTTQVRSGSDSTPRTRALVDLDVKLGDRWHTVSASLDDRSHMSCPVLLGRDILAGYYVDVEREVAEE